MQSLQDAVDGVAERSGFSGAVRLDRAGETEFSAAYGFADRAHEVLNTVETRRLPVRPVRSGGPAFPMAR